MKTTPQKAQRTERGSNYTICRVQCRMKCGTPYSKDSDCRALNQAQNTAKQLHRSHTHGAGRARKAMADSWRPLPIRKAPGEFSDHTVWLAPADTVQAWPFSPTSSSTFSSLQKASSHWFHSCSQAPLWDSSHFPAPLWEYCFRIYST